MPMDLSRVYFIQLLVTAVLFTVVSTQGYAEELVPIDLEALRELSQPENLGKYPRVLSAADLLKIQNDYQKKENDLNTTKSIWSAFSQKTNEDTLPSSLTARQAYREKPENSEVNTGFGEKIDQPILDLLKARELFDYKPVKYRPKSSYDSGLFSFFKKKPKTSMKPMGEIDLDGSKIILQQESFGADFDQQIEGTESGGGGGTLRVNGMNRLIDLYALPNSLNPIVFYTHQKNDQDLAPPAELVQPANNINEIIEAAEQVVESWENINKNEPVPFVKLLRSLLNRVKFIMVDDIKWLQKHYIPAHPERDQSAVTTMAIASKKGGLFNPILIDKKILTDTPLFDQKGLILHEVLRYIQSDYTPEGYFYSVFHDEALQLVTSLLLVCKPDKRLANYAYKILVEGIYNEIDFKASVEYFMIKKWCSPTYREKNNDDDQRSVYINGRSRLYDFFTLPKKRNPLYYEYDRFELGFYKAPSELVLPQKDFSVIVEKVHRLFSDWQASVELVSKPALFQLEKMPSLKTITFATKANGTFHQIDCSEQHYQLVKALGTPSNPVLDEETNPVLLSQIALCQPYLDQQGIVMHELLKSAQRSVGKENKKALRQATAAMVVCRPHPELAQYISDLITLEEEDVRKTYGDHHSVILQWCDDIHSDTPSAVPKNKL